MRDSKASVMVLWSVVNFIGYLRAIQKMSRRIYYFRDEYRLKYLIAMAAYRTNFMCVIIFECL